MYIRYLMRLLPSRVGEPTVPSYATRRPPPCRGTYGSPSLFPFGDPYINPL